jgi:hypothetical protein
VPRDGDGGNPRSGGGSLSSEAYRKVATFFAATIVVLGFALLVQTARHGGGTAGFLIGGLFVALGAGRLYLIRKRR